VTEPTAASSGHDPPAARPSLGRRLVERATRPPVLTWFAALQALVVVAMLVRYVATLDGVVDRNCRVVVGDYLAFHTGATLVASGEGAALWDLDRQRAVQEALAGCRLDRWQPYVNPPLLAAALVPLTGLGPRGAFHAFGAFSIAALAVAMMALGRALPLLRTVPGAWPTALLLVYGFVPVATTLGGGQNTALTLALLAGFYAALHGRKDAWAGLWLGLLSYKPVLLPVLVLVLVLRRRGRALAVGASVVAAHYALGAAVAGADWPLRLFTTGARYRVLEWADNIATHISLLPFCERLSPGPIGTGIASAAIALVVFSAARVARRIRAGASRVEPPLPWAIASAHLQYYDYGLAVLPVLLGVEHSLATGRALGTRERLFLAVGYLGYPAYTLSSRIGLQPLTLALVVLFAWLARAPAPEPTRPAATSGGTR
jgi:hypothetical protein